MAYGYTGVDGERTGLVGTFVRDGIGYVIDLDGPQPEEGQTLALWDTLQATWQYRPIGQGLFPNRWATISTADFTLPRPESFIYQITDNGWQRFSAPDDSQTFVALRRELVDAGDAQLLLDRWTAVAGNGVENFQVGDSGRFALGNRLWLRRDFAYDDASGEPVWGFIMVSRQEEQILVAWTEAPANIYEEVEQTIVEVMLAELR